IGRKLGRGGMGTVYEGLLNETGEPAAIKVLSTSLAIDEGFRERFKVEIETLRKLNHPNIVRLFGFGEQGEHLFYAMELVEGRSLEDEMTTGRRFTWQEVTEYAIQTCAALKHAHDRGVIHRDIKPANLLLGASSEIKLSDFGIAKLFGGTGLTSVGGVLGTAEYMAPEQTDGRPITQRSDMYSLGGVMYTLLAGRPPFKANTLVEMLQLQRFAKPEPVGRYAADVPEELQVIVADLLVKDPDQRIATAMVLSRRLEAMRHGLSAIGDRQSSSPTRSGGAAHPGPVTSATMTAPGAGAADPKDAVANDKSYELARPVEPGAKTSAAKRDRAVAATFDLNSPTAGGHSVADAPRAEAPVADKSAANGGVAEAAKAIAIGPATPPPARFVTVSRDEHRQRETIDSRANLARVGQAILLAAALAMIGGVVWYVRQPASADTIYDRVSTAAADPDKTVLSEARQLVKTFLSSYPDDPRGAEVKQKAEQIELYWVGRRADVRGRTVDGIETASPVERAYLEAMNFARMNPQLAAEKLKAIVDLYDGDEKLPPTDAEALLLAKRKLDLLRSQIDEQLAGETKLLTLRLDIADRLQPQDPAAARRIRNAVVELYRDKPWAAALVERAQAALADPVAAGPPRSP
ncbi:MAG TPA: protein kinase, partial [Pirellulales bacterium]